MALQGKPGVPVTVQFALYQVDGFTRREGAEAGVVAELYRSLVAGGTELIALAVVIAEQADQPGEYTATFTPDVADRTYTLVLRHADSAADVVETIQVWTVTPSDLAEAIDAASGIIVQLDGHPWGIGDPLTLRWTFRDRQTLAIVPPSSVTRAELIARDGETVIQTILGADMAVPAPGIREAVFAAVADVGTYYARLVFVPTAGAGAATQFDRVQVENLDAEVVAGVMSLEEFLNEFLGAFAGEPDARALLRGDAGEQLIGNEAVAAALRGQAAYVGRYLRLTLSTTRYASRPDVTRTAGVALVKGVDYDEEIGPFDYDARHASTQHGFIGLPHVHVQRVTRARLIYGRTVLWHLPTRWFHVDARTGTMRIIVDSTDLDVQGEAVTFSAIFAIINAWIATGRPRVPVAWAIDYEAGLPDLSKHEDLKRVIGWRAAAEVLAIVAVKANKRAVQNQSASKDGISRSYSVADSSPGGRYARLLDSPQIKDWASEEKLAKLRGLVRPKLRIF